MNQREEDEDGCKARVLCREAALRHFLCSLTLQRVQESKALQPEVWPVFEYCEPSVGPNGICFSLP